MPVKILVVDDEPDLELLVRQKFRKQIRANEFDFAFARNGVEALEKLEAEPDIDLVLTDINMPEMDGLELLAKIGDLARLVKSVIVSAYGDMPNIRTAMNRGAADFLTKPIDFADLEITINKTVQQVQELRQAQHDHDELLSLQRELDIAAHIQQSILPRDFPAFPDRAEFDVFAEMIPAREVGGDFYDFFLVDENHLGCVVADVSGKGIPAALFMAMCRALLKATAMLAVPPGECLRLVNEQLSHDNGPEMFVSIFYGLLDTRSGRLEYANGGHNPPLLVRRDGSVREIERTGDTVLGVLDGLRYKTASFELEPGDALLLYTDGVTEAMNAAEELFSERRLREYLRGTREATAEATVRGLVEAVHRFAGETPPSDDLTTLAVVFRGRK